ncbi:TspO/MBR family protein [Limoniibacter endophyticus]|uniref:Tryptophan-rich sensory protein n=1 Tax=Limoniibacter endophyticus TaxID=1565040 RepID=A0A8J3GH97_9HYPH|nr:TspO/MBR family protein [Limoniibacter endophyticus]GHC70627.1 tryptophan-rich sensory protein [Limoniibacter endophyticus]
MRRVLSLIIFLVITVGGGLAIGLATLPGEWYAQLEKPFFNPPSWIFSPVWTVLYVLIAFAGWRTFEQARSSAGMKLWFAQLVLNFLWSPSFFGAQRMDLALFVIILLLITILFFIRERWGKDRIVAYCFMPYAAWVAFATLLNASLLILN